MLKGSEMKMKTYYVLSADEDRRGLIHDASFVITGPDFFTSKRKAIQEAREILSSLGEYPMEGRACLQVLGFSSADEEDARRHHRGVGASRVIWRGTAPGEAR